MLSFPVLVSCWHFQSWVLWYYYQSVCKCLDFVYPNKTRLKKLRLWLGLSRVKLHKFWIVFENVINKMSSLFQCFFRNVCHNCTNTLDIYIIYASHFLDICKAIRNRDSGNFFHAPIFWSDARLKKQVERYTFLGLLAKPFAKHCVMQCIFCVL